MKKTSLYLEPELDEALAKRATDEGLTKAELIRRTLTAAVTQPPRARPKAVGVLRAPAGLAGDPESWRSS